MNNCLQAAANLPHINEELEQPTTEAADEQEGGKWNVAHMSSIELGKYALMVSLSMCTCLIIP